MTPPSMSRSLPVMSCSPASRTGRYASATCGAMCSLHPTAKKLFDDWGQPAPYVRGAPARVEENPYPRPRGQEGSTLHR
jgi:hypothetical protein